MRSPLLLLAGGVVGVVLFGFIPAPAAALQGQGPPTWKTVVVNTAANPVPVRGHLVNTDANPVPVRGRERPTTPFTVEKTVSSSSGEFFGIGTMTNVPAGKMFVIEFVSIWVTTPKGTGIGRARLAFGSPFRSVHFPIQKVHDGGTTSFEQWGYSGMTRIYATGEARWIAQRVKNTGSTIYIVTLSGYLTDA